MRWWRRAWAPLALAALLGAACAGDDPAAGTADAAGTPDAAGTEPAVELTVRRAGAVVGRGCALLADDDESRRRGLMGRTDLGRHVGMVFVFDEPVRASFWMRGTPIPLSIAFFDDGGGYVSEADMAPCGDSGDCPSYPAAGPYRTALEVPQGELDALGVGPGTALVVGGPCS